MTKEALEEEAYLAAAEPREKRIAELEEKLVGKENEFKYFSNSFKKKIADLEIESNNLFLEGAKRVEELEKENKELKTVKIPQLERRIASIRGCHSVDAKKLNARIEQVERLKQENAELRDKLNNLSSVAEVRLANWQKYADAYNETQELLDKQIEATYKVVEENTDLKSKYDTCLRENTGLKIHNAYVEKKLTEAKAIIKNLCGMVRELNKPNVQLTDVDYSLSEAEKFLEVK